MTRIAKMDQGLECKGYPGATTIFRANFKIKMENFIEGHGYSFQGIEDICFIVIVDFLPQYFRGI